MWPCLPSLKYIWGKKYVFVGSSVAIANPNIHAAIPGRGRS